MLRCNQVFHEITTYLRCTYLSLSPQISNIGFFDVSDHHVAKAISQDTLFIHGNSRSSGSAAKALAGGAGGSHHGRSNCTDACSAAHLSKSPAGVSAICDGSCSAEWSSSGPRLGGHNCGAGSTSRYGSNCRLCYTDHEDALAADITLALSSVDTSVPNVHVIMCDTEDPPPAASCSTACQATPDTVSSVFLISLTPRRTSLGNTAGTRTNYFSMTSISETWNLEGHAFPYTWKNII